MRRDSMQLKGSGMIGLGKRARGRSRRRRFDSSAKRPDQPQVRLQPRRFSTPSSSAYSALGVRLPYSPRYARMSASFLAPGIRLHAEQFLQHVRADRQARHVQVLRARQVADGRVVGLGAAGAAIQHPRQHAQVVAEARPQELAVRRPGGTS